MSESKARFKQLGYTQTHIYDDLQAEEGSFIVYIHDNGSQIWFYEKTKTWYAENFRNEPLEITQSLMWAIFKQTLELGWVETFQSDPTVITSVFPKKK